MQILHNGLYLLPYIVQLYIIPRTPRSLSLSLWEKKVCEVPVMAADVSSLFRVLNGYSDDQHLSLGSDSSGEKSTALITRDLLGGGSSSKLANESQELDLDLQVPNGWEKRLDLKVGLFSHMGLFVSWELMEQFAVIIFLGKIWHFSWELDFGVAVWLCSCFWFGCFEFWFHDMFCFIHGLTAIGCILFVFSSI